MEMLTGNGYPSKRLNGEVGQHYKDLDTGDIFELVSANEFSRINGNVAGGYIWKKIARGDHLEVCNADSNAAFSEVVILPETELTVDDGQALITTSLQAPVADGDTVSITYNGTAYECTGVAAEGMVVGFGNLAAVGGDGSTGNPDAPFVAVLVPEGAEHDDNGTIIVHYGVVMPLDGATTITLSIVQTGSADSGNAGGYLYITGTAEDSEADSVNVTMSMPFEVVLAAVHSGKPVFCALHNFKGNTMVYVLQVVGYSDWAMIFGSSSGQTVIEMMWTETNGCVARLIT